MNPVLNEAEEPSCEELYFMAEDDSGRLDAFCAKVTELSRSRVEMLCKDGCVFVNEKIAKKNTLLKNGDQVRIVLPENAEIDATAQDIPLSVIYEDDDIIVIDKPEGMVVHPAPGNPDHTLVNALLWHCKESLSGINGMIRPGIVHRLDKDTSGLILCAKNDASHIQIATDIKEHRYRKVYQAIIYGHLKESEGAIETGIGRSLSDRKKMAAYSVGAPNSKYALTHYRVLEEFDSYSLVELVLETGRTHQIRVHLQNLGHPVVDDPLYAPGRKLLMGTGQLLHACELSICHPIHGTELKFVSPLPHRFQQALEKIR